jgi:hypothetical protein
MPVPVCQCTQSVVPALGDDAAALAGQVEVGNVQAEDRPGAPVRSRPPPLRRSTPHPLTRISSSTRFGFDAVTQMDPSCVRCDAWFSESRR